MKKKFNINTLLKIGIIIYFITIFCFITLKVIIQNGIFINEAYNIKTMVEIIIISLLCSVAFVALSLFITPPFNFVTIYLIYRSVTKNKIKQNSKFNEQNIQYCREHLDHLSPGMLSYLKNFTIEKNKDISAHILKLIRDGYILVENNKLKISDKDISILSRSDKVILDIVNEKTISFNKELEYSRIIEEEAIEQKFITSKKIEVKKIIFKILGLFFIEFLSFYGFTLLFSDAVLELLEPFIFFIMLIALFIMFLPFFYTIYFIASFISLFNTNTNSVRTKKANDIVKNAYGLKKFLTDLNSFENKSWKEVYTRDYYLIYAVVLGINTKVPSEILEMLTN